VRHRLAVKGNQIGADWLDESEHICIRLYPRLGGGPKAVGSRDAFAARDAVERVQHPCGYASRDDRLSVVAMHGELSLDRRDDASLTTAMRWG
jgi:hypothetical protein